MTIESKGGLTSEEIERMKREADEYADADKKAKENADKVNNADAFAYQVSKSIDEFKDKVTDDEKKELSELTDALKKAADEKNIEEIDSKMKELQEKWYPIAQRVYQESVPKQEEEQKS